MRQTGRRIVTVIAVLVMTSVVLPPLATADPPTAQFGLSIASGRPGELVEVRQVDPCPSSESYQPIRVTFTDAAGVVTDTSYPLMASPDGTWPFPSLFYVPAKEITDGGPYIPTREAAAGIGTVRVVCLDPMGQVTQEYAPQSFTVTGPTPQFSITPRLARPGDLVHFESIDTCPGANANVQVSVASNFGMTYSPAVNQNDGSWSIDITVPTRVPDSMQGEIDIPLRTYVVKVTCEWTGDWLMDANYAMQTLEIRTAPVRYVALGDSFSSGEGAFDYIDPSDSCHKSDRAYAYLIADELGYGDPNLAACSGAVTQDIFSGSTGRQAQRDHLTTLTEVVTLTIGGNDALFADVLTACITTPSHAGAGCRDDQALNDRLSERFGLLSGDSWNPMYPSSVHPLLHVYREIHGRAPEAQIYVAGYPNLFGGDFNSYSITPTGYQCWLASPLVNITYEDALWINLKALDLNIIIGQAVNAAQQEGIPITYVPPTSFAGHGLCDSSASWFNGVVLDGNIPPGPKSESMHPTQTGHDLGFRPDFVDAINNNS